MLRVDEAVKQFGWRLRLMFSFVVRPDDDTSPSLCHGT